MEAQISSSQEIIGQVQIDSILEGVANINELFDRILTKGCLKMTRNLRSFKTESADLLASTLALFMIFIAYV